MGALVPSPSRSRRRPGGMGQDGQCKVHLSVDASKHSSCGCVCASQYCSTELHEDFDLENSLAKRAVGREIAAMRQLVARDALGKVLLEEQNHLEREAG